MNTTCENFNIGIDHFDNLPRAWFRQERYPLQLLHFCCTIHGNDSREVVWKTHKSFIFNNRSLQKSYSVCCIICQHLPPCAESNIISRGKLNWNLPVRLEAPKSRIKLKIYTVFLFFSIYFSVFFLFFFPIYLCIYLFSFLLFIYLSVEPHHAYQHKGNQHLFLI